MSVAIENMFRVMRVINASNEPMGTAEIAAKCFLEVRTVQRRAFRLAEEGLIDFRMRKNNKDYEYMRKGLKV